ncbi:NmrA family NAD(P)-binding protein [Frondihabitans cladoniiphilus]|uniref:SDR family oxidoreductase n=1 Tax=Frondihabitans cladoniiphilus TaxID=715785 RepID=A0ABP8WC30_9MICO
MHETILIAGATGATGGATLDALTKSGGRAAAMTRRTSAPLPAGATRVLADFDDGASLSRALDGVTAAYLVTPSSEAAEEQQIDFIDRARAAGVEHIVLLSQLAAADDSPVRFLRYHAAVEAHLLASGIGATILRPNLFMQGLFAFRDSIAAQGAFFAPVGDARVSAVDVRDIGAVAATALLSSTPLGTLDLTGPEALTHAEMALALGSALGKDVVFVNASPEDFATALAGILPPWQVAGLVEDYAHYAAHEAAAVSSDVERVLGRRPIAFAAFARDHAPDFA